MNFFSPTEAPSVHIELLPDSAQAVDVYTSLNILTIMAWAPGNPIPCTGESEQSFIDNYCDGCEFHCSELEVDLNGDEMYTHHGELYCLDSAVRFSSPCTAYEDGLSSVSFPCASGHDGPESEPTDETVRADYMVYGRMYNLTTNCFHRDYAAIQAAVVIDNAVHLTDALHAVNTYSNDNRVCWGETDTPCDLLEAETTFTTSFANEDLGSFDTHNSNVCDIENQYDNEEYELCASAIPLRTSTRPQAVVTAPISSMTSAFVLLGASGCRINKNVAYVPVYMYSNVAIDDDTVSNVWVTDVLPGIDKRLMFVLFDDALTFTNAVYLGQIDSDFNLQPCKSTLPQSSEQAVPDNNLSPA
jgi:hypothetical protein